jgi:hypothetical protein
MKRVRKSAQNAQRQGFRGLWDRLIGDTQEPAAKPSLIAQSDGRDRVENERLIQLPVGPRNGCRGLRGRARARHLWFWLRRTSEVFEDMFGFAEIRDQFRVAKGAALEARA